MIAALNIVIVLLQVSIFLYYNSGYLLYEIIQKHVFLVQENMY